MGPPMGRAGGTLRVALFGGLEVHWAAGAPLHLPSRKATALLAYLALSNGRVHARDKLAALLWPESTADRARASLR